MARKPSPDAIWEYRAPRWLVVVAVIAFLVFVVFTLIASGAAGVPRWTLWVCWAGALVGLGGVVEVLIGRVTLEPDSIVVFHWFRTERIPLTDVARVSLEGGQTALRLKTGAWKRMPEWLGANASLGRRIRDRLKDAPP